MKKGIIITIIIIVVLIAFGAFYYIRLKKKQKEVQEKLKENVPIEIQADGLQVKPAFTSLLETARSAGKLLSNKGTVSRKPVSSETIKSSANVLKSVKGLGFKI